MNILEHIYILRFLITAIALSPALMHAEVIENVVYHNEPTDTIVINKLLIDGASETSSMPSNGRVIYFAEKFIDKPYVAGTLEQEKESLVVNVDEFDCTTFVDNVLALAYTLGEGRTSWRDFVFNLQRLRYRGGEIDGFSSRLHYISDFIIDNSYRGNVSEVTSQLPGNEYTVKTIDYMSRNRDAYPALSDSAQYANMRKIESGYRSHRFPYIKSSRTGSKALWRELKDGDIVCITSKTPGLDVQHLGIVKKVDGVPHLIHASSAAKKVILDKIPLDEYMRKNRSASGIRVIRIAN